MFVSGIGLVAQNFEIEEGKSVEMKSAPTASNSYFQDRNPENTFTPFFNRALQEQKTEEASKEKRVKETKASPEYQLVAHYQNQDFESTIDAYR